MGEAFRKDISKQLGREPWELVIQDGRAVVGGRAVDLAELAGKGIEAEGAVKPGRSEEHYPEASFGAHFAEVAVNAVTGETLVRRRRGSTTSCRTA